MRRIPRTILVFLFAFVCVVSGCKKNELKDVELNNPADPDVNQFPFIIDSIKSGYDYGPTAYFYFHIIDPKTEANIESYNIYRDGNFYGSMSVKHPKWVYDNKVASGGQYTYQIGAKQLYGSDSKRSNSVSIKIP